MIGKFARRGRPTADITLQEVNDMKMTAWKKYVQVGVLAVCLMGAPLVAPLEAQPQDMPQTATRPMETRGENEFPWGLLGLLGLIGLAGLKRRSDGVERHRMSEPTRRSV